MRADSAKEIQNSGLAGAKHSCPSAARIAALIELSVSLVIVVVWIHANSAGALNPFDKVGMVALALALATGGIATLRWPDQALAETRFPLLCVLYSYVQGSLLYALFLAGQAPDMQSVVRLGLAMPLLYFASFALFVRQAYALPVVHGCLVMLQCAAAMSVRPSTAPSSQSESLLVMVLLQPLYLALLYWVNHQRRETIASVARATSSRMTVLAMVSHELRSPLQTLVGSLNSLERRMVGLKLPQAELVQIHRMRSAVAQLDSHLKDLLVVTRRGGELAPPQIQPFRLDLLLKAMVESYTGSARDRGCVIRLDVGEQCTLVDGDSLRIHQIINNLVNNAVKYTREGDVWLRASRTSDQLVEISVRDTGIGIDGAKISEVWQPHVRDFNDPAVAIVEGSGLGLTVVRLLVDMLDGKVDLKSEVGQGTTVTLLLPLPRVGPGSQKD